MYNTCTVTAMCVQLFQCVTRVHLVHLFYCDIHVLSCTVISMRYTRTLVYSYFNVLHAYSRVQLFQCATRVLSCTVTSMCYTRTPGTVIAMCFSRIKWLHTKQPKLGLTQEFVVDCAHLSVGGTYN